MPRPGADAIPSSPPTADSRSAVPCKPARCAAAAGLKPALSSATLNSSLLATWFRVTVVIEACAYFATFCSALESAEGLTPSTAYAQARATKPSAMPAMSRYQLMVLPYDGRSALRGWRTERLMAPGRPLESRIGDRFIPGADDQDQGACREDDGDRLAARRDGCSAVGL